MKKTVLILSLILSTTFIFGQASWESLTSDLADSNKTIDNPKKAAKPKTWISRAELLYEIHSFNLGGLYVGLPATEGIANAKNLIGEPTNISKEGNGEVWTYPHKKLFFSRGVLTRWEETDYIEKDAIIKASDALIKADELDEKKKLRSKTSFMQLSMQIRTALINKGIDLYQKEKFKDAYSFMEEGLKLAKYPKLKTDTNYTIDVLHYYSGVIAIKSAEYDKAKSHFANSIRMEYNSGSSYHYLAQAYQESGDSAMYITKIKEGFEKYPDEEQLVIDLINYYIKLAQPQKVIEYIDYAIKKNPENPSYYSAKATIYDNQDEQAFETYKLYMDSVHFYKKKAFQHRFDDKKDYFNNKQKTSEELAKQYKADANASFDKSNTLYEKALTVDSSFFNAAFNRGRLYYKRHERKLWESDILFKIYKDAKMADKPKNEVKSNLLTSAKYFEQAHNIKPKDEASIDILRSIYYKLRDKEKQEKYTELLNNIKKETQDSGNNID